MKMRGIAFQKLFALTLVIVTLFSIYPGYVHAASLSTLSDTMTRQAASTASNHEIDFELTNGVSSGSITVNFSTAGFTSGSVAYGDIDLRYGSSQAQVEGACTASCTKGTLGAVAGTSNTWGASFSSNILTFTYPTGGAVAMVAADWVDIKIGTNAVDGGTGVNQITNPSSVGTAVIAITTPSDTGSVAVSIDTGGDQVTVSASVAPTITFGMSASTAALGTMTTGAVAVAPLLP